MKIMTFLIGMVTMLSFLSIQSLPARSLSFGVGPSSIFIPHVSKGKIYERMILVSNADKINATFSIEIEGEIKNWTSFYRLNDTSTPISNITIPRESSEKILIKFSIPSTIANGNYTGTIYVQPIEEFINLSGQASVTVRMPVNVLIEVIGTQYLAGTVKSLSIENTEIGHPLIIKILFENTGDVIARPQISINVFKNNILIDNFTYTESKVEINDEKLIKIEWNTVDKYPGNYTANVLVTLGNKIITEKNISFRLYPRGTFTRGGILSTLYYKDKPMKDSVLKIFGDFVNTGSIETIAKLILEIYKDGVLKNIVESKESIIPAGNNHTFIAYVKITGTGTYTVQGYVIYETNKTSVKRLSFVVDGAPNMILFGGIAGGVTIFTLIYFIKIRKKDAVKVKNLDRKNKNAIREEIRKLIRR